MSREQWGNGYERGYNDALRGIYSPTIYRYSLYLLVDICIFSFYQCYVSFDTLYTLSVLPNDIIDKCLARLDKDEEYRLVLIDWEQRKVILHRRKECILDMVMQLSNDKGVIEFAGSVLKSFKDYQE